METHQYHSEVSTKHLRLIFSQIPYFKAFIFAVKYVNQMKGFKRKRVVADVFAGCFLFPFESDFMGLEILVFLILLGF